MPKAIITEELAMLFERMCEDLDMVGDSLTGEWNPKGYLAEKKIVIVQQSNLPEDSYLLSQRELYLLAIETLENTKEKILELAHQTATSYLFKYENLSLVVNLEKEKENLKNHFEEAYQQLQQLNIFPKPENKRKQPADSKRVEHVSLPTQQEPLSKKQRNARCAKAYRERRKKYVLDLELEFSQLKQEYATTNKEIQTTGEENESLRGKIQEITTLLSRQSRSTSQQPPVPLINSKLQDEQDQSRSPSPLSTPVIDPDVQGILDQEQHVSLPAPKPNSPRNDTSNASDLGLFGNSSRQTPDSPKNNDNPDFDFLNLS